MKRRVVCQSKSSAPSAAGPAGKSPPAGMDRSWRFQKIRQSRMILSLILSGFIVNQGAGCGIKDAKMVSETTDREEAKWH